MLHLHITQAAERKDDKYDDAFAPIPCPDCGQTEGDLGVFRVMCTYEGTKLLEAHVPRVAVEPAVQQAMQLYDLLHSRIDAANAEYGKPTEDDNGASEREFSVKLDGEN